MQDLFQAFATIASVLDLLPILLPLGAWDKLHLHVNALGLTRSFDDLIAGHWRLRYHFFFYFVLGQK